MTVGANENSAQDMGECVAWLQHIRQVFKATNLVLHHTGLNDTDRPRGSSVFSGAFDVLIRVVPGLITNTKMKDNNVFEPIGFELLPEKFTLSELQRLYEAILAAHLDKRNFRKKVLSFGLLLPLKETQMAARHRPAQLFRFDADKYEKLKRHGFNFEL